MGIFKSLGNLFSAAAGPPPMFGEYWTPLVTVNDETALAIKGTLDPDRVPEWFQRRNADWSEWDDRESVADALRKCTVFFACATYLADAVAEAGLDVYRKQGGKRESATGRIADDLRALLDRPNPHTSGAELMTLLVFDMCVCGYGVVEKVRGAFKMPEELWALNPYWLKRFTRPSGEKYWIYRNDYADRRVIEAGDLVFVPYYLDQSRRSYGVSPGQVAAREVGIDVSLMDFLKGFLDAGGIPPFVLKHPDPIFDDAEIAVMRENWRQLFGGKRAYSLGLAFLHGGWDLQEVGGSINEMAWPDLRGLTEQKIAQAYRIPLELIQGQMAMTSGGLETTRFEGAMTALQRYGAAPLRNRIDGVFTRGILSEFFGDDPTYDLAFDVSHVLALQEDKDALHTRARADFESGGIMLDEFRIETGREPLPNKQGQIFLVSFNRLAIRPEDMAGFSEGPWPATDDEPGAIPTTQPAKAIEVKAGRRYRNTKMLSRSEVAVRASVASRIKRDRKRLVEIGQRQLKAFWKGQGERIIAEAAKSDRDVLVKGIEDVDWDDELKRLTDILQKFYNANGEAAFAATADTLGVEISWDLANPKVQRVLTGLGENIKGIADESRTQIQSLIGDALDEGASIADITEQLQGKFDDWGKSRAETVARTETQLAYNRASALSYSETGEVDEVELHDNSAHVDAYGASDGLTCAERDGLVVKLSDVGKHIDAEHPNGSLSFSPILRTALGQD